MVSIERKLLEWIESKIHIFTIIAVTVLGLLIRITLRNFKSPDFNSFLSLWYELIKENGAISGLNSQIGNYNMLYQFMIALMTYLPIKSLYAYKLLSCTFDFAMAVAVGVLTYRLSGSNHKWNACLAYSITLLSPCVFLNSAAWAQCDAIYTFFAVAALLAFFKDKYSLTFILYGLALAFKLQAIFLLPFFVFAYFVKKNFSMFTFLWIPLSMVIVNIPSLITGRGIKEIYYVYRKQVDQYVVVHMNYPSFWTIFNSAEYTSHYESFKWMAIFFAGSVLGILMVLLIIQKAKIDNKLLMYVAFLSTYACVLFLPSMHERYGFCYEILAIPLIFINKKTIPLLLSLLYMTSSTYGRYLYQTQIDIRTLGILNTVTFLLYCYVLWQDIKPTSQESELAQN